PRVDRSTGSQPTCVVAGNLNGDAHPDLVVANQRSNTVSMLAGNGDGTFGPSNFVITGGAPAAVAIGDLNGDGRPDIILTGETEAATLVLLQTVTQTFQSAPSLIYAVGAAPIAVVLRDLNG